MSEASCKYCCSLAFVFAWYLSLIVYSSVIEAQTTSTYNGTVCIVGPSYYYNGTQNVTRNNEPCQRWDVNIPNNVTVLPPDGGKHNYCRNPNNDGNGVWCYIANPKANKSKDYCGIPKCPTDSRVIWTGYNKANKSTHIFALNADPELAREKANKKRSINLEHYLRSLDASAEFWSVTSDYDKKRFFFADYRGEHIGEHNLDTRATNIYFDGTAHGVESMAYDWISGNLYMTDSELKWLMVTEPTFTYYTPVVRTYPDSAYALTIHVPNRRLYLSTYRIHGSRILTSDLAGHNVTTFLKYPTIDDVTGLTIDYSTDSLLWTDFTGFGSKVYSCKLDGTNITELYSTRSSIYWGIGVYLDWIYITDVYERRTAQRGSFYYVWILNKVVDMTGKRRMLNYRMNTKPRGLTIYAQNNVTSRPSANPAGECNGSLPRCQQICLPSLYTDRTCLCGLGYDKINSTSCATIPPKDEFMLLADSGQGKIFYVPFATSNRTQYSLLPINQKTNVYTMAVNVPEKFLYWSDKANSSIYRSNINGLNAIRLISGKHAKSMAVEQQTGYVFFAAEESESIFVMNGNGMYLKTLYKPPLSRKNVTIIKAIALDMKNKFVYWTDSNSASSKGELRRMQYDGATPEIVYSNLVRPHALTIDLQSSQLFLSLATTRSIYGIPLNKLITANKRMSRNATKYSLPYRRRGGSYISELKVFGDLVYYYDAGNRSVEVFNKTSGTNSVRPFGPREFFRVRSLSFFSTSYYQNYIASLYNPCKAGVAASACKQLCLVSKTKFFQCECQDGTVYTSTGVCSKIVGAGTTDNPPTYHFCPYDIAVDLQPCQNTTIVKWTAPTWTDDKTATNQLNRTTPSITSPATLTAGVYDMIYSAADSSNQISYCTFTITVTAGGCGARPYIPARLGLIQSNSYCAPPPSITNVNQSVTRGHYSSFTFSYNLTCPSNQSVVFGKSSNITLINYCLNQGVWKYTNFYGIRCGNPGAITTSAVVSTAPTTRQKSVTTPARTTATTTTTAAATTTTTTTITPAETTRKRTVATTTKQTKTSTSTTVSHNDIVHNTRPQGNSRPKSKGLSKGALAAIITIILLLLIVVVVVVVVKIKRSRGPFVFPVLWKPKEDSINLKETVFEDPNHYSQL